MHILIYTIVTLRLSYPLWAPHCLQVESPHLLFHDPPHAFSPPEIYHIPAPCPQSCVVFRALHPLFRSHPFLLFTPDVRRLHSRYVLLSRRYHTRNIHDPHMFGHARIFYFPPSPSPACCVFVEVRIFRLSGCSDRVHALRWFIVFQPRRISGPLFLPFLGVPSLRSVQSHPRDAHDRVSAT